MKVCNAGTASTITGSDPWSWTCNELLGGSDSPLSLCTAFLQSHTVTASVEGNTGGSVICSPSSAPHGSEATCTATANAGYQFSAWTGACAGQPSTCTLTNIVEAQASEALFTIIPPASINGVCGTANGDTFTSAPSTNLCGAGVENGVAGLGPWNWTCQGQHGGNDADCSANIQTYTVTATANPTAGGSINCTSPVKHGGEATCTTEAEAGYQFSAWTGACEGQPSTCTLTNIVETQASEALFTIIPPASINGACGTANGQIFTSAPSANLCGAGVESGVAGFGPWNWTCQGQHGGNDADCSANIQTYTVTATANPTAGGSINCTSPVKHGGEATCTTEAEAGYQFSAWTGACEGQPSTCTLTGITTNQTSQAQFTKSALTALIPEGPQIGEPLTITPAPESNWVIAIAGTSKTSSVDTTPPANVTLPHGLVNLKLVGGISGSKASVVLTYPQAFPEGTVYYKCGKTLDKPTDHWYEFSGAVINGNTITLTIKDGGEGDNDLTDNSEIDDPGGPAVPAAPVPAEVTPVPTLGQWALLLLASLLGALGLQRMRALKAQ